MNTKYFIVILVFALVLTSGCHKDGLTKGERKALKNCLEYLESLDTSDKSYNDRIDTSICRVYPAWNNMTIYDMKGVRTKPGEITSDDYMVEIGDTSYHDFAAFVCDGDTYEIIGRLILA